MKNCKHCGTEHNLRGKECRVCKDGLFRYKMTRNDMLQLHESQNKQCALCEKELAMFNGGSYNSGNIDHCHTSGKVRGILCHQCNTFIGYLEQKVPLDKIQFYLNGV